MRGAGAKAAPGAAAAKPAAGAAMTSAQVVVSTKGATTGIPEVDKMKKVQDFAAIYGPTTLIKAQDWNGTDLEWVAVTPDSGKEKGRQVVMPLSMLMNAQYPEILDGYFPIYVRGGRSLGKVISKATVTVPRRPKKDMKLVAEELRKKRAAAAAAAAPAAGAQAGGAGGGRGGMGGGGRGGRGGMGGRRRGGMGGGGRGGRGRMG